MNEDKSKLEEGLESLEDDKLDDFLTTKAQSAVREKEMELDLKIRRAKSGASDEATDKIQRLEKTKSQVQRMAALDRERRAIRERSIQQARKCLTRLREETGTSFSTLAVNGGAAPSTITRFMGQKSPQFAMKKSTLEAIVTAAINEQAACLRDTASAAKVEKVWKEGVSDFKAIAEWPEDERKLLTLYQIQEVYTWPLGDNWEERELRYNRKDYEALSMEFMEQLVALDGEDRPSPAAATTHPPAASPEQPATVSLLGAENATDRGFRIIGSVEAGVMQEAFEIPIEEQDTLPIGTVRYGADCFALDVRGDSMDKKFPPGTVLICQPYDPEISPVPENKYVIAMRSSKSTAEVEATVKKLEKTAKGNYVLVPESNNMIHKPEPLEDVGEFSVYVYAVVVAAVNPV